MKRKNINLWPILPLAIILLSLLAAQFMPDAKAEKDSPSPAAEIQM